MEKQVIFSILRNLRVAHFEKTNDRFLQQYSGQKLFGNNIAVDL